MFKLIVKSSCLWLFLVTFPIIFLLGIFLQPTGYTLLVWYAICFLFGAISEHFRLNLKVKMEE